MLELLNKKTIQYTVFLQKGFGPRKQVLINKKITYNIFDYITPFKYYIEDLNLICWQKISIIQDKKLDSNLYKLIYDISKALTALHSIGILHNDTTLDNIGVYKGNFVLFDFDGSGTFENKGKDKDSDYDTLQKSISFHTNKKSFKFYITQVVEIVSQQEKISYEDAFTYLENLHLL